VQGAFDPGEESQTVREKRQDGVFDSGFLKILNPGSLPSHKILWDNEIYDRMIYPVGKGVILCQVTQSGILLSIRRRRLIPNAAEYLRV
jgi:hypothetical protein